MRGLYEFFVFSRSFQTNCQEVRLPGDRHVPPLHLLAEGDDAHRHPEGRPADQSPRDAPRHRARQDGDNDQDDQADAVKTGGVAARSCVS